MRIIGGRFKGRVIEMPKDIRPTSNKVREALFDILKGRIQGANFLDLYCGSGAVGIEALSRGAGKVVFVDNDSRCISVLKRNLGKIDMDKVTGDGRVGIYNKEVIKAIGLLADESMVFDIVFLDPPYYKDVAKNTLIEIAGCDILNPTVIIIAEIYKKDSLPEEIGVLRKVRSYRYGDTVLEFFKEI